MVPTDDSQLSRLTLLIFQSHKWRFCWNRLDVSKRAYWGWWINRLAMKIGDTPPPLPRRVYKPRIRDDQALNEFFPNSVKMHRATFWWCIHTSMVWWQSINLSSHNPWEKEAKTLSCSTYQLTNAASSLTISVLSIGRVIPGNQKTWTSLLPRVKNSRSLNCRYPRNFGKQLCSCSLYGRGGQFADRHKASAWGLWLGGMPFNQKQWPVSPC